MSTTFTPLRALKIFATALVMLCCLQPRAAASVQKQASLPTGQVARCFDGDTLQLTDRRIIRLAGIDSPELTTAAKKTHYYARQARQKLTRLALNKKVRLLPAGTKDKDHYGRIIADVLLEDGQSLSDIMVSSGAAFFYPHQNLDNKLQQRLKALQQQAVRERRGLWAHLLSQPQAQKNYIGNQESLRFFPADCPEVQRIKPRNRVHFGTLMDAFLTGYAPARICDFWPTVSEK
ncbi:MAG: thermonuclease family protein [Desulfovibrio sp.]|jgi:endonuclease YncB( thermonuclease family)|nr:thermonuclease family protein [Desulfovibrio sp.]